MPLLKRREFQSIKPPEDLDQEEDVFVCRLTNEVFRHYDDFFKRTILCNSLVWSCSLTSRPGLTYQEALESEERARKLLASFPVYLEAPMLFLVTLTCRGRLADMCDDVFVFARERYFIGEIVDVSYKGRRETCRVERVIPPGEYGKQLQQQEAQAKSDNDEVMIIGDNGEVTEVIIVDEEKAVPKTPKTWKPKTLQPSGYKYEVLSLQGSGKYKVSADKVSRKKGLYTRDKNKLYLKQNCKTCDMKWIVKPEVASKYKLENKKFTDFFAGPMPNFASTPAKRNRGEAGRKNADEDDMPLTEVKKKEDKLKKREKLKEKRDKEKVDDKPKKPRLTPEERDAMRQKLKEMKLLEKQKRAEERMKERDIERQKRMVEKAVKKEELKRAAEEDREKRKKEREVLRLEKLKMEEALKEWNKPREDLECDDLKDLPKPNPVKCKIPQELFGDALMLMEFLYSFGDQLSFQEEFPEGITLDMVEEALFSHQVDGALYDLLKFLLSSVFHLQDEEEEDEKVDIKEETMDTSLGDLAEILNDDDPTYAALSKAASSALIWSQIHQGAPLRNLPLESTTISEVLRLHLLASGAETSVMDARWRYQQRGAYTFHDDPGLELRLKEPAILKSLTNGNVYDLSAASRMMIINALCNQILTYVTVRDVIEESWDQWQVTKKDWKEMCRLERHREKEESAARYKRKLEERAQAQLRVAEEHRKAQEKAEEAKKAAEAQEGVPNAGAVGDSPQKNNEVKSGAHAGERVNDAQTGQKGTDAPKGADTQLEQSKDTNIKSPVSLGKVLSPEQKERRRLKEEAETAARMVEFVKQKEEYERNLVEHSTRYSVTPVGLDRIFRRYWVFQSIPGLFVEFDKELMDGLDARALTKGTPESGFENGEEAGNLGKDEQNSSGLSEDSNKENKDVDSTKEDVCKSDVKSPLVSSQKEEETKLISTENRQNGEMKEICRSGDEVEPMEVTEIKDTITDRTITDKVEQTDKVETKQSGGEVIVNGITGHDELEDKTEGDKNLIPQSPIKEEETTSCDDDSSNQELVPWAYYSRPEEITSLLESLNSRGYREGELKVHLDQHVDKIIKNFDAFPSNYIAGVTGDEDGAPWSSQKMPSTPRQVVIKMTSGKKGLVSNQADGDETLELLLREAILDLEERVWQGGLGVIKVDNRVDWIAAIEQGSYDRQCKEMSWGPLWARSLMDDSDFLDMSISEPSLLEDSKKSAAFKNKDRMSELKKGETPTGSPATTRCSTPTILDNIVRDMGCSLLQISQGLHEKYLIKPLGIHEEVKRSGPRPKKVVEKEKEENEDKDEDGEEEKKPKKTCRDCWEESLMASSSLSQVFLHLSTLEQSILWSKSILNARCRICRRKGDAEAMLLCDYCDRGHHMYCLKPPLKNVPKGDWYCKDCTPKAVVKRTPRKSRRKTFDEEAEEKVEDEEEEEDDSDSSEESSDDDAEEDEDEEDGDEDNVEDDEEEEEDDDEQEDGSDDDEEAEEEDSEEEEEKEEEVVKEVAKKGRQPKAKGGRAPAAVAIKEDKVATKTNSRGGRKPKGKEAANVSKDESSDSDTADTSQHGEVCAKCSHGGKLVFCSKCQTALHLGCCEPPFMRMPRKEWQCNPCKGITQEEEEEKPKKQTVKGKVMSTKTTRRRTLDMDADIHSVQVDEEITLNISDDGTKLKKSLREMRQEAARPAARGTKRTRSAEEDADTEEEEEEAPIMPSKKRSLTVVLTKQDKELRKIVSQESIPEHSSSYRRRSSTSGRGSSEMQELSVCEQFVKELVRHPDAGPFLVPVSKKLVPDYYRVIKRPMDFATIQSKMTSVLYKNTVEFVTDVRLIFANCQQYNRYQSYEAKKGRKMWAFVEDRIEELGIKTEGPATKRKDDDGDPGSSAKRARRKKVITDL